MATRIHRAGGNDTLRHKGESLGGLKGRAWGILTHDTAIEQGFPNILTQYTVVLTALTTHHHTRIVRGRRHHTEHLARRGFDGHDTAYLAFHQSLAKGLQLCINAQRQVFTWLCPLVEGTVLITALYTSVGIAQKNLDTLDTTQLLLVVTLHTQLADIIARLVIIILFDISRRHLGDIA